MISIKKIIKIKHKFHRIKNIQLLKIKFQIKAKKNKKCHKRLNKIN